MKEASLALAAGCDAVSLYWYDAQYPEPLERYEEFVRLAAEGSGRTEAEVREALSDIPAFFGGLFPPERGRLLHCLVKEVVVRTDGIDIEFRTDGMGDLVKEVVYGDGQQA